VYVTVDWLGTAEPATQLAVQTRIRTTPNGGLLPVSDCDTATPKAPAVVAGTLV